MDYEFRKNLIEGGYSARFSMEHQFIARWVIEDLGTDDARIQTLLNHIEAHLANGTTIEQRGPEMTLTIEDNEVVIQSNDLFSEQEFELEQDMDLYQSESIAECGIEDFEAMLHSWRAFFTK
jgi:uncharacterized protein YacL (UPF0231 family)